jgi:iron complex outermembrane receptor protein
MATTTQLKKKTPTAAAVLLMMLSAAGPGALAQTVLTEQRITVTGRAIPSALTGFGDVPAALAPMQAGVVGSAALADAGVRNLADLTRLEAGLSDAYNSEGYWSALSFRGYVLDARGNYRRDGLPIHAETWLPLANKERVELLAGTSGQQSGTSSPGGLVNLVVKRPAAQALLAVTLEARDDRGSAGAALDWSGRSGADGRFGWRLNAAASRLKADTPGAEGQSRVLALATEWRLAGGGLLEAEFEHAHRSQPSVPAMSLFGGRVPDPQRIAPRLNLNTQPWTQPVVFDGNTASLRWRQMLEGGWALVAHGAVQRLRTDDRVAFPFGCDDGAGGYLADRFCPDGRYDLYDYRSDGEQRSVWAAEARAEGSVRVGGASQHVAFGAQRSRLAEALPDQAFNYSGQGQVGVDAALPAAPDLAPGSAVQRAEASTALFARARLALAALPDWQLWLGLRSTELKRRSSRDGIDVSQRFTTPWLALQWAPTPNARFFASSGQGVESDVVPNRPQTYRNAGQVLPALRSRQGEIGWRFADNGLEAGLTAFDIRRPQAQDRCTAGAPDPACVREVGSTARHRGVQAQAALRSGGWEARASAMLLRARIESAEAALAGTVPTNVPERSLKLGLTRELSGPLAGLSLGAALVHEGPRHVLPGQALTIPGWTRLDLLGRFEQRLGNGAVLLWRAGVDNATDERAWRESPYQFGHAWLFPLQPRSLRLSVEARL